MDFHTVKFVTLCDCDGVQSVYHFFFQTHVNPKYVTIQIKTHRKESILAEDCFLMLFLLEKLNVSCQYHESGGEVEHGWTMPVCGYLTFPNKEEVEKFWVEVDTLVNSLH